jgi:hypothetical protein
MFPSRRGILHGTQRTTLRKPEAPYDLSNSTQPIRTGTIKAWQQSNHAVIPKDMLIVKKTVHVQLVSEPATSFDIYDAGRGKDDAAVGAKGHRVRYRQERSTCDIVNSCRTLAIWYGNNLPKVVTKD